MPKAMIWGILVGFLVVYSAPALAAEKKNFLKYFGKADTESAEPAQTDVTRPGLLPDSKIRITKLAPIHSYPVPQNPNKVIIRIPQPPPPPPEMLAAELLQKSEKRQVRTR